VTLLNGVIYLSFASHGDNQPYHGWLFGYNATNLSLQPLVYNATPPTAPKAASGMAAAALLDAQGNMYLQTGNGTFRSDHQYHSSNNYAMSR